MQIAEYTSTAASCCTVHSDWFAGVLLPLSTLKLCRERRNNPRPFASPCWNRKKMGVGAPIDLKQSQNEANHLKLGFL